MKNREQYLREIDGFKFWAIGGGDGSEDPPGDPANDPPADPANDPPGDPEPQKSDSFTADQQRIIDKIVATARKEGREAAEKAAKDREAQSEKDRERDDLVRKGKFEEAEAQYKNDLAAAKAERAELDTKVQKYQDLTAARVENLKTEIPEEALEDFPEDADMLIQLEWLESRKALLAKLNVGGGGGNVKPPPTPKPGGAGTEKPTDKQLEAVRRQYQVF